MSSRLNLFIFNRAVQLDLGQFEWELSRQTEGLESEENIGPPDRWIAAHLRRKSSHSAEYKHRRSQVCDWLNTNMQVGFFVTDITWGESLKRLFWWIGWNEGLRTWGWSLAEVSEGIHAGGIEWVSFGDQGDLSHRQKPDRLIVQRLPTKALLFLMGNHQLTPTKQ